MPSFDEAMSQWKAPTGDDMEFTLPPRREPKKEPEADEPRDLGQHGGGADAANKDGHDDAAAAPSEPEPQRDEPDEGEHTDSTQEQVAARARRAVEEAAQEAVEAEAAEPEPAPEETAPVDDDIVPVPDVYAKPAPDVAPKDIHEALGAIDGDEPREFKRLAFSAGEDAGATFVKRFPQQLIDRLRLLLATKVGGEFADQISATGILAAYVAGTTGVTLDFDENTAVAAEAFRTNEPRVAAVEERIDVLSQNMEMLADAMKLGLRRISETGHTVDAMDYAMAYLVTDRVAGLSTADTNETNVDVTNKKVLTARETIRARAREQRSIETQRDGRRLA